MDRLERELQAALRRTEPAEDFAARVMRAAERPAARAAWPRWLAMAAAVVLMAGAGIGYRQYRGEVEKERVMRAFRIASVKVNQIQEHVREAAQ